MCLILMLMLMLMMDGVVDELDVDRSMVLDIDVDAVVDVDVVNVDVRGVDVDVFDVDVLGVGGSTVLDVESKEANGRQPSLKRVV